MKKTHSRVQRVFFVLLVIGIALAVSLMALACSANASSPIQNESWEHEDPPSTQGTVPPEPVAGTIGTVTTGDAALLIWADIVTPSGIIKGGQVLIDSAGVIQYVGLDASGSPLYAGSTKIVCKYGLLAPGFINCRSHNGYGGNEPAVIGTEQYDHRLEWLRGYNGHTAITYSTGHPASYDEVRHVMSGTTSSASSGGVNGMIRNFCGRSEGLSYQDADFENYPLGNSNGPISDDPQAFINIDTGIPADIASRTLGTGLATADGLSEQARAEFIAISDTVNGMIDALGPKTVLGTAAALRSDDLLKVAERGTSIIWTPRNDLYLFGDTLRVTTFANAGGNVALGSYWTVTGSTSMLREIKAA